MRAIQPGKSLIHEPEDIKREYPTSKPVVQYIRQSTERQVKKNKQSTKLQDEGLSRKLDKLGYSTIIKIDEDQGKSGQKRRDERAGLDKLLRMAETGEVGSIAAYDASRLYRDLTRVNYTAFVHMCETYRIPVITYARTFWPDSRDDMNALIDEFKSAAKYIEEQIEGKLLPAKAQAIELGASYGGHAVPIGFIMAETEDRKHYQVYEPHAERVRAIFRRYRELGGNLARLGRELQATGFKFPAFSGVKKIPHIGLKWDGSGYTVRTRNGLIGILTNVAYIGWYLYDGVLVSKEAHDPIVPMDDFMYAYNRLSPTTLDGEPNEDKPKVERRYGLACDALLEGILESNGNTVYATAGRNAYVAWSKGDSWDDRSEFVMQVRVLDRAVSMVLVSFLTGLKLKQKFGVESELHKQVASIQGQKEQEIMSLDESLENIEKAIREAELEKKIAKQEEYEQGVREAIKDLKRLNAAKAAIEAKIKQVGKEAQEFEEAGSLLEQAVNDWKGMKFGQRRMLVKLVVERANIVEASPHFVKLELFTKAPLSGVMTIYIHRDGGYHAEWTEEEDAIIREMYPTEDKARVLEALPNRSWYSVQTRASDLKLPTVRRVRGASTMPNDLAYSDLVLMKEVGMTDKDTPYWTVQSEQVCEDVSKPEVTKMLLDLVLCKDSTLSARDAGASLEFNTGVS